MCFALAPKTNLAKRFSYSPKPEHQKIFKNHISYISTKKRKKTQKSTKKELLKEVHKPHKDFKIGYTKIIYQIKNQDKTIKKLI